MRSYVVLCPMIYMLATFQICSPRLLFSIFVLSLGNIVPSFVSSSSSPQGSNPSKGYLRGHRSYHRITTADPPRFNFSCLLLGFSSPIKSPPSHTFSSLPSQLTHPLRNRFGTQLNPSKSPQP
ncbi:hypothetical protein ACEPAG_7565 [Sanghuangporus baumii]